jgi:hypothetical protein
VHARQGCVHKEINPYKTDEAAPAVAAWGITGDTGASFIGLENNGGLHRLQDGSGKNRGRENICAAGHEPVIQMFPARPGAASFYFPEALPHHIHQFIKIAVKG